MSESALALQSLLVGALALVLALRRAQASPFVRRHRVGTRVALAAAAVLALGACHSIDQDAFAHAPVPLGTLPFREPVAFGLGAQSGQPVRFGPGLLASYFAGAQYERLDHQQVDANVDFAWDGTGNPVISAPDGIDHNDGDFRLPESWGIWSVVWEGYLLAPSAGTYRLRIHVNNGGWLQMTDAAGALVTVIACPGGTSFEGDCEATRALDAGPHHLRFSYYNNAPPAAVARLLWQPPGATDVSVVPTEALRTQLKPLSQRSFIFVHGIRGDAGDKTSFASILAPLRTRFPLEDQVLNFHYFQDLAELVGGTCRSRPFAPPASTAGLPLTLTAHSLDPSICDSQSDVGVNAVLLDADVRAQHRKFGGPVTIIANSMGGAIVRAFLAYAVEAQTGAADPGVVSDIFFLQSAQQGSCLAYTKVALLGLLSPLGPAQEIVFDGIAEKIRQETEWDATRPAIDDLTPVLSATYNYANPSPRHVPDHIRYYNVASDIRWTTRIDLAGTVVDVPLRYRGETTTPSLGDYVMLPGSDDPTRLPLLGGERFAPSVIGRGQLSQQWILRRDLMTEMSATVAYIPTAPFVDGSYSFPNDPLHVPESHFELGSKMDQIFVTDRVTGESLTLDEAILREIERQGQ